MRHVWQKLWAPTILTKLVYTGAPLYPLYYWYTLAKLQYTLSVPYTRLTNNAISSTRDVEAEAVEAEARKIHASASTWQGRMEKEKKLVLLSFVEERIGAAYTLRNESEEESFREMLTST